MVILVFAFAFVLCVVLVFCLCFSRFVFVSVLISILSLSLFTDSVFVFYLNLRQYSKIKVPVRYDLTMVKSCSDAIIGFELFVHFVLRKHPKVLITVASIITFVTVGSCPPSFKSKMKDRKDEDKSILDLNDDQYEVLYVFGTAATIVSFLGFVAWLFCPPHNSGSSLDLACA